MKNNTKKLVLGAIMVALATVLSMVRIYKLPWGGSITLLSMLPLALYSIKYGVKWGVGVSFVYALGQFLQGVTDGLFGWGLTPTMLIACIILDYILAFSVIGLAGMFRKKGIVGAISGIVIALLLRLSSHFLSGIIIWKSFGQLWNGFSTDNTYLYSLLYNGTYMLPEIIFTVIGAILLLKLPQINSLTQPE